MFGRPLELYGEFEKMEVSSDLFHDDYLISLCEKEANLLTSQNELNALHEVLNAQMAKSIEAIRALSNKNSSDPSRFFKLDDPIKMESVRIEIIKKQRVGKEIMDIQQAQREIRHELKKVQALIEKPSPTLKFP